MDEMKLKINADKTEVIIFGNQKQIDKCTTTSLVLDSNLIEIISYVKYLGGGLDKNLNPIAGLMCKPLRLHQFDALWPPRGYNKQASKSAKYVH